MRSSQKKKKIPNALRKKKNLKKTKNTAPSSTRPQ